MDNSTGDVSLVRNLKIQKKAISNINTMRVKVSHHDLSWENDLEVDWDYDIKDIDENTPYDVSIKGRVSLKSSLANREGLLIFYIEVVDANSCIRITFFRDEASKFFHKFEVRLGLLNYNVNLATEFSLLFYFIS